MNSDYSIQIGTLVMYYFTNMVSHLICIHGKCNMLTSQVSETLLKFVTP